MIEDMKILWAVAIFSAIAAVLLAILEDPALMMVAGLWSLVALRGAADLREESERLTAMAYEAQR